MFRAARMPRLRIVGLAAAAMTLTLVALPAATAQALNNQYTGVGVGDSSWRPNDAAPMDAFPGAAPLEFDQRQLYFGQVITNQTLVAKNSDYNHPCGTLTFKVTRYQNYWLTWDAPTGASTVILYRGGLVADYSRPYVGVFFGSGNRLEIRTYNRKVAYDRYGDPIPGAVYNSWTAASVTAPQNKISLEKNGLHSVNAAGTKSPWKTGGSGC